MHIPVKSYYSYIYAHEKRTFLRILPFTYRKAPFKTFSPMKLITLLSGDKGILCDSRLRRDINENREFTRLITWIDDFTGIHISIPFF